MRAELNRGLAVGVQQNVIHLGDVYYSGFSFEYRDRFLNCWPVKPEEAQVIGSWSLPGNHDMYSGGDGYFNVLLADPRFKGHAGSSWFLLENEHWRVIGLDTASEDGGLAGSQAEWLESQLTGAKRTIVLSHHQLFSVYGEGASDLRKKALPILARHPVDAWFWGHEHRCMIFSDSENVRYGCCLGHGGVPVYQWHQLNDPVPAPGTYEYRAVRLATLGLEPWAVFGFAIIDLHGKSAAIRYVNEVGFEHHSSSL